MALRKQYVVLVIVLVLAALVAAGENSSNHRAPLSGNRRVLVIPWHINYQGYLEDDTGNPITDTLGMSFHIYTASTGGTELWNEAHSLAVENGIFNVILGTLTPIQSDIFGAGESRWLELVVETETLSPRTELTSVGYSYRSVRADSGDYASDCDMVDSFNASATPALGDLFPVSYGDTRFVNEGQVDGVTTSMILDGTIARGDAEPAFKAPYADTADYALSAPGAPDNDWAIAGNVLHPSGDYGLLMRSGNMHHGSEDSTHVNLGTACTTGTAGQNHDHCTVGGGFYNAASGLRSTVSGGYMNEASNWYSTVSGGESNNATGSRATVSGGANNVASVPYATVSGGESNTAGGSRSFVGGGYSNSAPGNYSFAGGGQDNAAIGVYSTVCGGLIDSVNAYYGGVLAGCANLAGDEITDTAAVVAGGWNNSATGRYSSVGGGTGNSASWDYCAVAGGNGNAAGYIGAAVSGGQNNRASGYMSAVPGGEADTAAGDYSFAAGRQVSVTSSADYTFAFGRGFRTNAPHAVVFHNSVDSIRVGIGNISPTHLLDVGDTGAYCNGGVWTDGSSRDYKENITELTLAEALHAVSRLSPVKYNYKTDRGEDFVGFIAEDVPDLVATSDRRGLSPMDIVAVLTRVVQHQQEEIENLRNEINEMKRSGRQ